MGWELWIKGNKYRLWSSTSDKFLTEKLTRNQMLQVLEPHYISEGKLKIIKEYYAFPFHWPLKGTKAITLDNKEGIEEYHKWYMGIAESENYYEEVDKKYKEVLESIKED